MSESETVDKFVPVIPIQRANGRVETMTDAEREQLIVEKERLEFYRAVHTVYSEAEDLLLGKHRDYGPRNIADAPGGALNGLRVRIHDKIARINNLIDATREPEFESLRDSFVDLANYALISVLVLDEQWPGA